MSCIATPTKTEFTTIASTSTLTTSTDSVTTRPPGVTTILTSSCSNRVLGPGSTTCIEQVVTEVSTVHGGQTTVQVPIVIVFQITQASPTRTLFAPCSNTAEGQPGAASQSLPSSSLSISDSLITTTVTPAPTIIVSESTTTLRDGSVEVETLSSTSSFAPIPIVIPALASTSSAPQASVSSSPSTSSIVGPIVGGVLGGFFGLIGVVFLIWWLWKKRRKFLPASLVSEKPDRPSDPRLPQGYVVEPQRYEYGQVGSATSHRSRGSPPRSLYARSSQSHSHSHAHSISHSAAQPSLAGTSSQWIALRQNSSPTPPMLAPTAIMPAGPSSANLHSSSGSSFPGYAFQNPPPSSFPARAAVRSGYGSGTDDEQSSEGHGSVTFVAQRPPSRSSRRRSPTVERRNSRPQSSERRSATIPTFERLGPPPQSRKSFSGAIEIERPVRPAVLRRRSTDATPVYEEPRSPLFVVNHTEEPSGSEAEPENETPSPP